MKNGPAWLPRVAMQACSNIPDTGQTAPSMVPVYVNIYSPAEQLSFWLLATVWYLLLKMEILLIVNWYVHINKDKWKDLS